MAEMPAKARDAQPHKIIRRDFNIQSVIQNSERRLPHRMWQKIHRAFA